ncbi:adenosylcobinamide-GDP ribazoletransferase [Marinobacterium nitratireducens]|uniref:Adenosylcobinamide-GDP ribazoletransferase n=1 Tax=Marinobacterium nitratireducens TaxID=518897 RepID=A0A917ZDR7_9GAMM|nr:adenosylcobinamide-GDP ribazoletransferase [Marinobacterium nitratireducens]GGO80632.1 adenosylcobinamide-GDP ribazoletransferase [Marinobacterium nitratireducens]
MEALTRELHLFFNALTFFTRIPPPAWVRFSDERLNQSSRYFPLVGLLVGAATALLFWLLQSLLPLPVAVLLSIAAGVLLTGGFHEDGLADVCDGFGGGSTAAKTLRIMKDSRLGSYGALGLLLVMALKLTSLLYVANVLVALLVGHSLSRFVALSLIRTEAYVREDLLSKSRPLARRISDSELLIAALPVLVCLLLLPPAAWIVLLLTQLALRAGLVWLFRRKIGGYTGDCLGATQQLSEVLVYIVLCLPLGGLPALIH